MKKLIIGVFLIAALILAQTASADSRHYRRGYDLHGYSSHYYPRGNPYHFGYSRRYYSPGSYYGGGHFGSSYGNYGYRRHRRHNDLGYLVGGLVLGSLLSSSSYREPRTRIREVVYVKRSASRSTPLNTGRRLLKDLEGNCFERKIDGNDNEIRVQLEASECNF
ncbi:MAG TPA: hypothetical protein EYG42_05695 [Porticoccaceae bacterium]|jgi:hypothetical protein|nr:hypothetical protein [Porticoccaceae bacterium]